MSPRPPSRMTGPACAGSSASSSPSAPLNRGELSLFPSFLLVHDAGRFLTIFLVAHAQDRILAHLSLLDLAGPVSSGSPLFSLAVERNRADVWSPLGHFRPCFLLSFPFLSSCSWVHRSAEVLYGQTIADAMSVIPVGVEGAIVQAFLAHRTSGVRSRHVRFIRPRADPSLATACLVGV